MIITLLCGHDHLWWIIAMSVRILQSAPVTLISAELLPAWCETYGGTGHPLHADSSKNFTLMWRINAAKDNY